MIKAVFDANILVSAFLSRDIPGGAANELLRFVRQGAIQLHLSPDIIAETLATLIASERLQTRYGYTPAMAIEFCDNLRTAITMVINPPPIHGAVPRDSDDDKIVACAVAAGVDYLVSRDDDLLSLGTYAGIAIVSPEHLLHVVRSRADV